MARRPDDREPWTEPELAELRRSLSLLRGPSVEDFYRQAHKDCTLERHPEPKAIQRLVTAWKILRKWGWRLGLAGSMSIMACLQQRLYVARLSDSVTIRCKELCRNNYSFHWRGSAVSALPLTPSGKKRS